VRCSTKTKTKEEQTMRWIGLDCHLEFIEVAILDPAGALVSAGRIESSEEAIGLFAEGLAADDRVALESSANAAAIAALIRPHVGQVVIANSRRLAQISQARAKTDRLDSRTLAKLLRAGALEEVWNAGRAHPGPAAALLASRHPDPRPHPGQERGARGARPKPQGDARRRPISSAAPDGAGSPPSSCPPMSG
jgi:Transposase